MGEIERRGTTRLVARDEWRWVLVVSLAVVAVGSLPYLIALLFTPPGYFFTGQIYNPIDGHSYLAKMRLGHQGNWLFTLPYTPEPQQGSFIYTYYLLLGHVSRLCGLPLVITYHLARILGAFALLFTAYRFLAEYFVDRSERRFGFWVVALSSGLGWLTSIFGVANPLPLDLLVPEYNTFFSSMINAHFPLMETLMYLLILLIVSPLEGAHENEKQPGTVNRRALTLACSAVLALVQPLALFVLGPVLFVYLLVARKKREVWTRVVFAALGALPFVVYDAIVFTQNPEMRGWMAQNLTPTPPLWLVLVGFGLLLPPALVAIVQGIRNRRWLLPIVWLCVVMAMLYAPLPLQRRMTLGLHLPLAILASLGLTWLWPSLRRRAFGRFAIVLTTMMTSLFLLVGGVVVGAQHRWPQFMTTGEYEALYWLSQQVQPDELVLASPEMGLLIPAWAGNKVIFGHEYETIDAQTKRAEVDAFFSGLEPDMTLVRKYDVQFLFFGPQERADGLPEPVRDPRFKLVHSNSDVRVYRITVGS